MSQQPSHDELRQALRKSAAVIQEQKRALAGYDEPIAVIGMGCRFPGEANSPDAFWELLRTGISAVSPRSVIQDYPGHYLGEPGWFDAAFFGIAPREAQAMDPQQQLLLEVCVEAFEDARIVTSDLLGSRTGVYMGVMNQDYAQILGQQERINTYAGSGSEASFLAGRLSYSFGLHGPSMTIGTACSSSLVTTHLACQSLRHHECDLAVAGGVSLILTPMSSRILSEMHATAPDGMSKTFDASADGYGRGEGCGVLILKRRSDAERDGDTIYALIRSSAVNHDGRSGGLTVPNGLAQETLLRQALAAARVEGAAISYVEAHGTGTVLGDPIELRALGRVMGERTDDPAAGGLGQDQHRPPGGGCRGGGAHEGDPRPAASADPGAPAPAHPEPAHPVARVSAPGSDAVDRMDRRRSASGGGQLLWAQRSQCPHHPPGGTSTRRDSGRRSAPAPPAHAIGEASPGADRSAYAVCGPYPA